MTGTITILTTDDELLDFTNFHDVGSRGRGDENPSWARMDYTWLSDVLTSDVTIQAKIEITEVTDDLKSTVIEVRIDPPRDKAERTLIGTLIFCTAFWIPALVIILIITIFVLTGDFPSPWLFQKKDEVR
ncbi:MAG: hypothetical protein JSU57_05375 [Candidatus Heimdallarchaeota archaeon]|nr:MAG: hypothetical protein JSU57_05375 [Candidatus Heimdallarchaeota archaeon]